jgi:hypothetical protein
MKQIFGKSRGLWGRPGGGRLCMYGEVGGVDVRTLRLM